MSLLQHYVTAHADRRPDATAIVAEHDRVSYGTLERRSNQIARLLRELGCLRGDRVHHAHRGRQHALRREVRRAAERQLARERRLAVDLDAVGAVALRGRPLGRQVRRLGLCLEVCLPRRILLLLALLLGGCGDDSPSRTRPRLFFLGVGMSLDIGLVLHDWPVILGGALVFMLTKATGIYAVARLTRASNDEGIYRAAMLAQGGEFAFVLYSAAAAVGVFDAPVHATLTAIVIVSMALTPLSPRRWTRFSRKGQGGSCSTRRCGRISPCC